ncbi:segregation/condensation protein A [Candidatus Woesearchaeota archaeon]|nr:segregation/condensation protein A [Candidatus Woesearchaeota archaeon]
MMAEETIENIETPGISAVAKINPGKEHHENIYDILMNQDEITWRSILIELIKTEQMDPWDINLSKLSKMYIKTLKKLKEMNLQLSGKVLLAAAILLRIKSSRLVGDDLMEFDRLLASGDSSDDLYSDENFVEGELGSIGVKIDGKDLRLIPKTPQPRKRKVSVYDLIDALAIALNVRRRRVLNQIQTRTMDMPEKKIDISQLMDDLYNDVVGYLNQEQSGKMAFSELVPGDSKQDKIYTFVPLLHLTNARKVDLEQQQHFGEIWVKLAREGAAEKKADMEKKRKKEEDKKNRQTEKSESSQETE